MIVMAVALAAIALTGGSSRYDVPGLIVLRPLLVIAIGLLVALPARTGAVSMRAPLGMLGLLGAVVALQLIPMPPPMWTMLPQRLRYLPAAVLAGEPQPWRPISIVPVLTLNSLLALLPAAAMLFGFGRLGTRRQQLVVPALLVVSTGSALLGIFQIAAGAGWQPYLYDVVATGLPEGLFVNRNHQAALLAGSLPILAVWAFDRSQSDRRGQALSMVRIAVAVAAGLLALLVVLATGSRSGLVLVAFNILGSAYLIVRASGFFKPRVLIWAVPGMLAAGTLITMIAVWSGRGSGFSRFLELGDPRAEMRFLAWPVLKRLAVDYLPWGSGFGTFDPLFRIYEPDGLLNPSYFNAAHNDLLELAITGGVPALVVLLVFAGWYMNRVLRVFAGRAGSSGAVLQAQGAAMMVATFLLASISDYPLRSPLAGALVALACALLERGARSRVPA